MTEELFILLVELMKRNYSPRDSKELIDKYCINTIDFTDPIQIDRYKKLNSICIDLIDKKKQEGFVSAQKRKEGATRKEKVKPDWNVPRFFSDFSPEKFNNEILCHGCKEPINSNNVFKWFRGGKYDYFCLLPSCWQNEDSDLFEKDRYYRKFVFGK
jgi:hypothetical protein